jgi:hypothetical protein
MHPPPSIVYFKSEFIHLLKPMKKNQKMRIQKRKNLNLRKSLEEMKMETRQDKFCNR